MVYISLKNGMKKIINTLFLAYNSLPSLSNWKAWIFIAIIFKSLIFILNVDPAEAYNLSSNTFAGHSGDAKTYIEPIENLLKKNSYEDDYRMPGYGWIYYLYRLFFNKGLSLNILVITQLILSSISVYALSLLSIAVFKKTIYFYLTFLAYLISIYVSLYDYQLLTESFGASSLVFTCYFLVRRNGNPIINLLLSGLFITWSFFLKPITAPLLLIFSVYILLRNKNSLFNLKKYNWNHLIIFLLPLIVMDGLWSIRNYNKYEKFIPITKTTYYPETENSYLGSLYDFTTSFGGSIVWWRPGSEMSFFKTSPNIKTSKVTLPNYIYTSKFNNDSLIVVRDLIEKLDSKNISTKTKNNIDNKIKIMLNTFTKSIKDEKPFLYYIGSRIKVLKSFFITSGTQNLFRKESSKLNLINLLIKIFYSGLYLSIVLLGFLGNFSMLAFYRKVRNIDYFLISSVGLYLALAYPLLFKLDENRYFAPAYPFFVISACFLILKFYAYFRRKFTMNA